MIFVGIALQPIALTMHGFPRGLLQGAGIALILIGVAVLSARVRRPKDAPSEEGTEETGGPQGMWLPSRDEDQS